MKHGCKEGLKLMSEAYDDAFSPLLRMANSIAATPAANTSGDDRMKRQKPVNMDMEALPARSADDSSKPDTKKQSNQEAINQRFFFCDSPVMLGENFLLGGILTTKLVLSGRAGRVNVR